MKKENVTIPFESEQLAALEFSFKKKNTSVQAQLEELLKCLYESEVPEPVREYLASRTAPVARPRRPQDRRSRRCGWSLPLCWRHLTLLKRLVVEMARQEKIVLWIDRRWLTAIEKRLNGQTRQEHMEDVLDELCNQLPEREYARISKAIQAESTAAREREEAAQTWSAYRVLENGEEWCFKVAPGEELLNAAERLNRYLKESPDTGSKFIRLFSCGTLLTSEEYQQMIAERMENTGKVRGVFDVNFDKREFSAVHIMDGWRTWAMRDVSAAVYHATRSQFASSDDKWRKLLDHLSGKEITSAGHLSARNFSFGDEIIESNGKLNFYVQTEFDVDAAFGTFVLTDENDDWLNVYANYDIAEDRPCDTLELTLCKGDGSEESWSYQLNAAEQDVLLRKMEEYCQQQTGMSLHDYAQQFREEPEQQQGPVMKL